MDIIRVVMMLSLFAIGFSEACLDTAPFRRALFELENGSGEEIALAQKIRMGEELSASEKAVLEEFHIEACRLMLKEFKANLQLVSRANRVQRMFSGACTDSVLALSDMTENGMSANRALKKAESTYPLAVRNSPYTRVFEDPILTWIAEDAENFERPTYHIYNNGLKLPEPSWRKIFNRGGMKWVQGSRPEEITKTMGMLFGSDEVTTYFSGQQSELLLEQFSRMHIGEHGGLGYSGDFIFETTPGSTRREGVVSHIVFIYRMSDESFILLDQNVEETLVFSADKAGIAKIKSFVEQNEKQGFEGIVRSYFNRLNTGENIVSQEAFIEELYGMLPRMGEELARVDFDGWRLCTRFRAE